MFEILIIQSPPPPAHRQSIGRQHVQHPAEMLSVGADCCSHLPRIFIVIPTVDDRSLLILVLEARLLDVDHELNAIGEECQRVTDMACVLEC